MSFFPEGKSNNGVELLPFCTFLKIAIDSGSGVQLIAFRWTHANGQELSKEADYIHLPREAWVHCSAPVQSIGFAKKAQKPGSRTHLCQVAEKNWTRKKFVSSPRT